jgi:dihydroorotase
MLVLIRQAKIVDPRSDFHDKVVDLLIEDGSIKSIAPSIKQKADTVIEAEGLHLSPGWIDVFADYREPGYEQKETIKTGLDAAAAGGFTDVLLAPNTNPVVSSKSIVEFVTQRAARHVVNLHPLGAATQDIEGKVLSEMLDMRSVGAVAFTDGWKPVQNANLMLKALEYIKAFDGVLLQIPVENTLSAGGLMHEGPASTRLGMPGIPEMAETLLVHRDIELLRYTNSRLHITGVSTATSVEMIRRAKAEGLDVTCSVTPYHLALTDEALSAYSSMYKVSPPLRTEADRQALIAGLKDGTIDCIASHHRPQEWDAKEKEFEYASDGMNIQEIAFNILWQAVGKEVGITRLVEALAIAPAKIFNIDRKPLAEGGTAAFTLFTTAGTHNVAHMKSLSRNNPFIGKEFSGKIIGIINNTRHHFINS